MVNFRDCVTVIKLVMKLLIINFTTFTVTLYEAF